MGVLLVSPWFQNSKSGTSHIKHHTSQITYCIWIGRFLQNISDQLRFALPQLIKTNPKEVCEIIFLTSIWLTIQTSMSSPNFFKPTISLWNEALSKKLGFTQNCWKKIPFFYQVYKKILLLVIPNPWTCVRA